MHIVNPLRPNEQLHSLDENQIYVRSYLFYYVSYTINDKFNYVLVEFLEDIKHLNLIPCKYGNTSSKTWIRATKKAASRGYMDDVGTIISLIPESDYLAYIKAVTCVITGAPCFRDIYCECLMSIYHIFKEVTTLSFADVHQCFLDVSDNMLFSSQINEELYDFSDHWNECVRESCSCSFESDDVCKTLIRYVEHQNNLRIHALWNEWDDDTSMLVWLPQEMIVDVLTLLGSDVHDNTYKIRVTYITAHVYEMRSLRTTLMNLPNRGLHPNTLQSERKVETMIINAKNCAMNHYLNLASLVLDWTLKSSLP